MLLLLAVFMFGLSGCQEKENEAITPDASIYQDESFSEVTNPNDVRASASAPQTGIGVKPKGGVKLKGKPFRGKKWSKKNGVEPPCSKGLGLCDLGIDFTIGVDIEFKGEVTIEDLPSIEGYTWFDASDIFENENSLTGYSQKITFMEYMPELEEFNTFMSEDDDFVYPTEIAELFDVNALTIVGQDYPVIVDNDHEFGYVIVDVSFQ
ncbi:MAG: hypothetical protein JJT94_03755 [Bernardetiaceae bacterium]|nr:hypothetical protein [Bernardetiaceae bacterium]